MARDTGRDHRTFNCSQEHEHDYVTGLYSIDRRPSVRALLKSGCADNTIKNSTHYQVYTLIKSKLGYDVPV